jgi:hypothetical protein
VLDPEETPMAHTDDAHEPDPGAVLTALTTEHFTLQGARSQTVSESSARSSLYIGALSSVLVALGFIGQFDGAGDTFNLFALTALPTLFVLGLFTFVRLVQNSVEDTIYGRAINRIRHRYLELAGNDRRYFLLSGHDDEAGVRENMGLGTSHAQPFFTAAAMVAVVNSVVGGAVLALLIGAVIDWPLGVAAAAGGLLALASITVQYRFQGQRFVEIDDRLDSIFPSPAAVGKTGDRERT